MFINLVLSSIEIDGRRQEVPVVGPTVANCLEEGSEVLHYADAFQLAGLNKRPQDCPDLGTTV